jgi:hypothetical protein
MHLAAIMPVRSEAWVLGLSARVALHWCDSLVILDHASTDSTPAIIEQLQREYPGRVLSARVEGHWDEMGHRQMTLEAARAAGATHLAIIDADEVLTGNLLKTIRPHIENLLPGFILQIPGYNLRGGIHRFHANGIWGNRIFSLAFKDDGQANWQGDRFHHREPFGFQNLPYRPIAQLQGGIMHLWGADERRLVARHSLYKITERLRWPEKPVFHIDQTYSLAIHESASNGTPYACKWGYADVPVEWWGPYQSLMGHLDLSAVPWQEAECQRLSEEYGAARFAGLDLFGVASPIHASAAK